MPRGTQDTYPVEINITVKILDDMPRDVRDPMKWATELAHKKIKGVTSIVAVNKVIRDRSADQ